MQLGPYKFVTPIILAPMAGVSDLVFRALCREHGADYAPSEMTAADPVLRRTSQTQRRLDINGDLTPRVVQIAGADPAEMATAAREAVVAGAEIVDINMGCPAKRVCNRLAGSALLKDEGLVSAILSAVVGAVAVPVTLKTRTGWDPAHRNAVKIARLAEDLGIQAITLHGRTRACAYLGVAEYDTIAEVKAAVKIPVIANGDITSPSRAREVLEYTGADGLMIGRAAQGDPWIFARIKTYLDTGVSPLPPTLDELYRTMRQHVRGLHEWYGEAGVRIARKHVGWYFSRWLAHSVASRAVFNTLESASAQLNYIHNHKEQTLGEAA
ncbi:MAG: tRNA dihydrouridine synthase DusB [Gammaproteobacteria bacterium]|nr:tRNA dihydrouridine synthase DusB [Gammaproteobacteria bacterium]